MSAPAAPASAAHLDLPHLLRRAARCFPAAPAVSDDVTTRTLAEVLDRARRLATALGEHGLKGGETVAVLTENRLELPEVDAGIVLAGGVRLALNVRLHLEDHRAVFADADVRVLVHSGLFEAEAAALAEEFGALPICLDPPGDGSSSRDYEKLIAASLPAPDRPLGDAERIGWITYTSGTTGRPKGIALSHRALREVAFNLLAELDPIRPGEQIVLTQPLSHGAGYFVLPYLISGAGVRISSRFDPERIVADSARSECRTLKIVPAMLAPILEAADGREIGYSSVIYGASPISRQLLEEGLERFGPVFSQVYGQSEAPVTLSYLSPADHVEDGPQRFSAGRPFRATAIEVWGEDGTSLGQGEEGEVVVCSSTMMSGYCGQPEATAEIFEGGWLRTRDIGRFDERGFLYLLGRSDEMINSGGFNIAPREVEFVLGGHPEVEEVAVIGVKDERWGEAVAAVVKPQPGSDLEAAEIAAYAKPRLGLRAPKEIVIAEEIAKTPYGKVDRSRLRGALEQKEARG